MFNRIRSWFQPVIINVSIEGLERAKQLEHRVVALLNDNNEKLEEIRSLRRRVKELEGQINVQ